MRTRLLRAGQQAMLYRRDAAAWHTLLIGGLRSMLVFSVLKVRVVILQDDGQGKLSLLLLILA